MISVFMVTVNVMWCLEAVPEQGAATVHGEHHGWIVQRASGVAVHCTRVYVLSLCEQYTLPS